MDSLYSILRILRPGEIRLIKHYYSRPANAENKMRLALLNLAETSRGLTNSQAIEALNTDMSASGFSHLKARLKADMLNALLWQESSKRFPEAYTAAEFECSRNIAQAYVLMMRGNVTEGLKLLERSKKLAGKFELLSHHLIINQLMRRRFHSIRSKKELETINSELTKGLQNISSLNQTEEETLVIAAPQLFSKNESKEFSTDGEQVIERLADNFEKTGLSRIGFWYYMAATEYYRANDENQKMLDYGKQFFELIKSSDALRSNPNISGASQTVGIALVKLHRFKEAEEYLRISVEKFRDGGMNQLNSLELLVKSQLAAYGTHRSKQTIERGETHRLVLRNDQLKAKWSYFKACREFLSSKPDQSYSTLNSNGDLLKSRDDLNVQYRVLEVLQLIELEDYDWIDFKLDTLRKFVSRNRKLKNPRIDGVIKVLNAIHVKSYRFEKLNKSTLRLIDQLSSHEKNWAWNPTGNELVRFDAWLERRMG